MAQADADAITRDYLKRLVEAGIVSSSAFAMLCIDDDAGSRSEHDPIEIVLVDAGFDEDILAKTVALEVATWDLDPRVAPFPVTPAQWDAAEDSPMLLRASRHGTEIRL